MSQKFITTGNKIELCLTKHGKVSVKEEQPTYTSQFMQWTEEYVAQIAVPIYKGQHIGMSSGDEYLLTFYTTKGLYRCRAVVLEQSMQQPTTAVKLASEMEKYERRRFYRMGCIIPLTYAVLTAEQKEQYASLMECGTEEERLLLWEQFEENAEFFDGTVLDISGGGMRFNSVLPWQTGEFLLLRPDLPAQIRSELPLLLARLISSQPTKSRQEVYENRVEYIDISAVRRKVLICYIFQEERKKLYRDGG